MPLPCDFGDEFYQHPSIKKNDSMSLNGATDMLYIKKYCYISSEMLILEDVDNIEPLPPFQDVVL